MGAPISSLDELVDFIASVASQRFAATQCSTSGAYLASEIWKRDPSLRYDKFGLTRLGDAVRTAETRGLVHRHTGVKHLEISPGPRPSVPTPAKAEPTRHIAADIWRAFVFFRDEGERFYFDTVSRRVLGEAERDHQAVEESPRRYIEIKPIASSTQQAWMREFIESHASLKLESAPIGDPRWWSAVPQWLRQHGHDIERSWNRFRTTQVAEYLRQWAEDHKLDPQFFRVDRAARAESERPEGAPDEGLLRKVLTDAVQELPLETLGEIAIPVRLILRYFRAR